jgi:hypothetical protein
MYDNCYKYDEYDEYDEYDRNFHNSVCQVFLWSVLYAENMCGDNMYMVIMAKLCECCI